MLKRSFPKIIGCIGLIAAQSALAIDPIPTTDGFSGYINLGVGGISGKSNMIAGNSVGDIGKKKISSLTDSPSSESDTIPVLNGELQYTFAASRTQLYAGNQLEDFIEFDFSTLLGVRHEFADKSIVAASFTFSALPTEVWKDPYLTNKNRSKTDRDSKGVRLEWDKVAGSEFAVKYAYRKVEIDDELSGKALGLSNSDAGLLERDGDIHNIELSYNFNLGNGHFLKPKFNVTTQRISLKTFAH